MKLYHVSLSKNLKVGDIIHPSWINEYDSGWGIYYSASPTSHETLFQFGDRSVHKKRHNVYQVIPIRKDIKIKHGNFFDELIVKGAVEVVACLGQASKGLNRSIVVNSKKGIINRIYKLMKN